MPLTPATRRLLRERAEALRDAQDAFNDALVEAFNRGGGMREIGDEVGHSHTTVARMLERLGVRKRWLSLADANRELERRDRLAAEARRKGK